MAVMEILVPWGQQPQEAVELAPGVPWQRLWVAPRVMDLTRSSAAGYVGPNSTTVAGPGGLAYRLNGVGSEIDFLGNPAIELPTQGGTFLFVGNKTGVSTQFDWGVKSTNLGERCGGHLPFSDGNAYFDFGGATSGSTRVSVSTAGLVLSARDVWIMTAGPRGMEIWWNGILLASNAANPVRSVATAAWGIGCNGVTAASSAVEGNFYALGFCSEQLPVTAIVELGSKFYETAIAPQVLHVPSAAAGGGAHVATGTLTAGAASIAGAALRYRVHASTGALVAQSAVVTGSAARAGGATTHASSGALSAGSAAISGAALRYATHSSAGALVAASATLAGTANHVTTHTASGSLVAASASISGVARRPVLHASSGAFVASPAGLSGAATLPGSSTAQSIVFNVALDGSRKRDLCLYVGQSYQITVNVYRHDGDLSPVLVTDAYVSAQSSDEYRMRPLGLDFTAKADYSTLFPFIIAGVIDGERVTIVQGNLRLVPEFVNISGCDYGGIWQ